MRPINNKIQDRSLGGGIYNIMVWHMLDTSDGGFDSQLSSITTTNYSIPRFIMESLVNSIIIDINNLPHL